MQIREKLTIRAALAGLTLTVESFSGLEGYFELLGKWNRRVSLTALHVEEADDEAVDRLLIEPALAAKHLPLGAPRIVDVGSGGGSPAIPMMLVAPGASMLMIESKNRKAAFLREAVRELGLSAAEVEASRFEDLLFSPQLRGSADVVTLRAVKIDPKTLSGVQAFLQTGGLLFLFAAASSKEIRPPPHLLPVGSYPLLGQFGTSLRVLRKMGPD